MPETPAAPSVPPAPCAPDALAPKQKICVIAPGTQLRGTLAFSGRLVINGGFSGEVHAPEGDLRIGPEGEVRADIEAMGLQVEGMARGTLLVRGAVELRKGADVQGAIRCARLLIEEEAMFEGHCECRRPASPEPEKAVMRTDLSGFFTAARVASIRP